MRHICRAAVAAVLTVALVSVAPAEAAPKAPGKVKTIKHSTTSTSITVSWSKPARAVRYRVCLRSWAKGPCRHQKSTKKRSVTFSNLRGTAGTDWYVQVFAYSKSGKRSLSKKRAVNMYVPRASVPRYVRGSGHYLVFSWPGVRNAEKYRIQISPYSSFGSKVSTRTTSKRTVTLGGLNSPTTYYVRVQALNGVRKGRWSSAVAHRITPIATRATVVTFNACAEDRCRTGRSEAFKQAVPVWSKRKALAGDLIAPLWPDFVVTQEDPTKAKFRSEFAHYAQGASKSAKSILYRSSRYQSLDSGWVDLDPKANPGRRFAVWQIFRHKANGTTFVLVNAHLEPFKGATLDAVRRRQMGYLVSAIARNNPRGYPVVYAGDWNSNASNANQSNYPGGFDAPAEYFAARGFQNAVTKTAKSLYADFNSANQGTNPAKRNGHHIDAVFVDRSTKIDDWRMLVNLVDPAAETPEYRMPLASDHNPIAVTMTVGVP